MHLDIYCACDFFIEFSILCSQTNFQLFLKLLFLYFFDFVVRLQNHHAPAESDPGDQNFKKVKMF